MVSPTEINLRRVLVGHRAAVNVVDFDDKYIVSASGDRTIKVGSPNRFKYIICHIYAKILGQIILAFERKFYIPGLVNELLRVCAHLEWP